jgi:hypothetical protein
MIILLGVFAMVPSAIASARHHSHIQHFLLLTNDPSDNASPIVIARGRIHAQGTDIVVSDTKDIFKFKHGSLYATHHVRQSSVRDSFDKATCLFVHTERGTYRVTGGTGRYQGAYGHGHYSVRAMGVGCDQSAPPDYFNVEIRAAGPLHF